MAEAAMFSVAGKLLITIASPAFKKAYERACSIKSAREDLSKLEKSIRTIHAVLHDAEKRQDSSASVKNWIKRVRDVLYDADDLFDEVATDDMLREEVNGNKLMKKVRAFISPSLNQTVSDNSIAKKVKDIRKSLFEISEDMKAFHFVECLDERPTGGKRRGQDPGLLFLDSKKVIGRDKDKKTVLKMILTESSSNVSVIAIVGIGGMGKTTLAQLVYSDKEVQNRFRGNTWFASISNTTDDREVIGKIYQSMCGGRYEDLSIPNLQDKIKSKMDDKKFLLVLDDVWDEDRSRWQDRISFLSRVGKGSKLIVTTRSKLVAESMGAIETHHLEGLLEEESWNLFKSIVGFTPEQEKDPRWTNLGREILNKCANVPLAVKCIASLLFEKNTIQEWESLRNVELPRLIHNQEFSIMPVLKLSYDHLPSNLKRCFTYFSLFPKGQTFREYKLVGLWISQGYIKTDSEEQNVEDVGHSYFMDLVRKYLLQKHSIVRGFSRWKMHDLFHDLAQNMTSEENIILTASSSRITSERHVSVGYSIDHSWADPHSLLNVDRIRSFLYDGQYSGSRKLTLERQFANFKCLRALTLASLAIATVPSSIGELKHLRYLDVSGNEFLGLPDAITKLINLCTLDVSSCMKLEALPNKFRKLTNLRSLVNWGCHRLYHMPLGFEELSSLRQLDRFIVSSETDGGQRSKLDTLSRLKLIGQLRINFFGESDDWSGVECWQPPPNLKGLQLSWYMGSRIPHWGIEMADNHVSLTNLCMIGCSRVKCLPPFRHLPDLTDLTLRDMNELEYIQGEEEEGKQRLNAIFLPNLNKLYLENLPKLKGWSKNVEVATTSEEENVAASTSTTAPPRHRELSFPSLSKLTIRKCPKLNHSISCPSLHILLSNCDVVGTSAHSR